MKASADQLRKREREIEKGIKMMTKNSQTKERDDDRRNRESTGKERERKIQFGLYTVRKCN